VQIHSLADDSTSFRMDFGDPNDEEPPCKKKRMWLRPIPFTAVNAEAKPRPKMSWRQAMAAPAQEAAERARLRESQMLENDRTRYASGRVGLPEAPAARATPAGMEGDDAFPVVPATPPAPATHTGTTATIAAPRTPPKETAAIAAPATPHAHVGTGGTGDTPDDYWYSRSWYTPDDDWYRRRWHTTDDGSWHTTDRVNTDSGKNDGGWQVHGWHGDDATNGGWHNGRNDGGVTATRQAKQGTTTAGTRGDPPTPFGEAGPSRPSSATLKKALPAPWEKHFSDAYRCDYFWNSVTGESMWEQPAF